MNEAQAIKLYEEAHEAEIFLDTIIKLYRDRRDLFNFIKRRYEYSKSRRH